MNGENRALSGPPLLRMRYASLPQGYFILRADIDRDISLLLRRLLGWRWSYQCLWKLDCRVFAAYLVKPLIRPMKATISSSFSSRNRSVKTQGPSLAGVLRVGFDHFQAGADIGCEIGCG